MNAPTPDAEVVRLLAEVLRKKRMEPYEDGKGGWLFREASPEHVATIQATVLADRLAQAQASTDCECPPCPGRGNDGHGMTHCAECCYGTGVEADMDCPTHGQAPTDAREALARVEALVEGPCSDTYRPYAVVIGTEVRLAVLLDDLRAALSPTAPDAGQRDLTEEPTP